jgi:hypothetical protein
MRSVWIRREGEVGERKSDDDDDDDAMERESEDVVDCEYEDIGEHKTEDVGEREPDDPKELMPPPRLREKKRPDTVQQDGSILDGRDAGKRHIRLYY